MSLEEALNKNTAAVLAHNALLEKMLAGGKAPAAPAAGTKPAAPAAGTKPAAPAAGKPAGKPAGKKAETTAEHVAERVTAFLKVGDKALRDERKEQVKTIIDHYGADRFTNIDPASFDEALGFLKAYEDGEVPDFGDDGGDEGDGDDDMV